jgi:hypothetical protein
MSRILVIGDTQVKPGHDLSYISHIGSYIAEKRPETVVCIGDWWDFESLSSYDRGKRSFEGRRLIADIDAGHEAMRLLFEPLKKLQAQQRRFKKKVYEPRMVFCMGNHEERADRVSNDMPEFEGFVGTGMLNLEQYGWEVYDFLQPVEIEGIYFVHYLANPFTGRPYSGTAMSILKTVGKSFVVGHKQCLDVAIRPTIDNKMQIGIVNGASYPHDESYKGYQGNNHFRGVTLLNEAEDGFALPCFVSMEFLEKKYGGKSV